MTKEIGLTQEKPSPFDPPLLTLLSPFAKLTLKKKT